MYNKIYDNPDIYKIYVPLPNNPLKNLNCYVVKTPEKNLIIDTGFNLPECLEALEEGLNELGIDINKTEMFITHLHSDHTGLVSDIMKKDSTIYMSRIDYGYLNSASTQHWFNIDKVFEEEGFPVDLINKVREINPSKVLAIKEPFEAVKFDDNYKFKIGNYEFTTVMTPGHTPGHACLYMEKEKIMFLGDHVLFDISPNITSWIGVKNSLKDYLESLDKIKSYDIVTALPAHRKNDMDVYERIEQLKIHHKVRLQNTVDIILSNPGITTYLVTSKMKWSMRGKSWEEFPDQQKWFAFGETLAHIDYLIEENKIFKEKTDGIFRYYVR